jgi:hypothetical protein
LHAGKNLGFISERWLLTRWRYGVGPRAAIGWGRSTLVLPAAAPPQAQTEVTAIQAQFSGTTISTLSALLSALDTRAFGLLHFAAHNTIDYAVPPASRIKLDQRSNRLCSRPTRTR